MVLMDALDEFLEHICPPVILPRSPGKSTHFSTGFSTHHPHITGYSGFILRLSRIQLLFDEFKIFLELFVFFYEFCDLAVRVHCGGVVSSAELVSDRWV